MDEVEADLVGTWRYRMCCPLLASVPEVQPENLQAVPGFTTGAGGFRQALTAGVEPAWSGFVDRCLSIRPRQLEVAMKQSENKVYQALLFSIKK